MKRFVLWAVLVLGSAGAWAQTATTPAPAAQPAPLPAENTLKITDTTANGTPAPAPATDITVWDFVKMFVILALVLGMILGFVWFMRRLSGQGAPSDAPMRVLHSQTLGGSRSLQVVEVGDQVLLVGVGDAGVTLVKELTGTEAADAFQLQATRAKAVGKPFADLVAGLLGQKPKIRPDVGEPVGQASDFLKKQRERLKNL